MRQIVAMTMAFGLCVTPVLAQDDGDEVKEGFSLMEEGAKMLLRGLMSEVEPAIDDLRGSLEDIAPLIAELSIEMGPAFAELLSQVDDFGHYSVPEFLPNGDIIMRRKPTAPLWVPETDSGEIDL